DAIPIRLHTLQLHPHEISARVLMSPEVGLRAIFNDEHILISVPVVVAKCGGSYNNGTRYRFSARSPHVRKAALSTIQVELHRLTVRNGCIHQVHIRTNVTIRDEQIEMSIQICIEDKQPEREDIQARLADTGLRGAIDKATPRVPIGTHHLAGEIGHEHGRSSR